MRSYVRGISSGMLRVGEAAKELAPPVVTLGRVRALAEREGVIDVLEGDE